MAVIEINGGPITHRYLMGKTKDDLANMYMRLLRETERDAKEAERYRTARCMTPHQWSAAWELNEATGKPFDEIIDNMRPFVGGR